jgi:hypothetical protein
VPDPRRPHACGTAQQRSSISLCCFPSSSLRDHISSILRSALALLDAK